MSIRSWTYQDRIGDVLFQKLVFNFFHERDMFDPEPDSQISVRKKISWKAGVEKGQRCLSAATTGVAGNLVSVVGVEQGDAEWADGRP